MQVFLATETNFNFKVPSGHNTFIYLLKGELEVGDKKHNKTSDSNLILLNRGDTLKVKAKKKDILIVLSGSGNSPNVISAINTANQIGLKTFAIVAFDGGKCNDIANYPLHFSINDMQIAEDLQLIIGHLCMQWLSNNKSEFFG